MTHNIPTAAHCPICGAVLMNASLHMAHIRLYCETCRRFVKLGPRIGKGTTMLVKMDLANLYAWLKGRPPVFREPEVV